jgi:hypothetical protein
MLPKFVLRRREEQREEWLQIQQFLESGDD